MRVGVVLLFCLVCLAFTAQAAPAPATDTLHAPREKDRNDDKHKNGKHGRHHHRHESHKKDTDHSSNAASRLKSRGAPPGAAADLEKVLLPHPQDDLFTKISEEVTAREQAIRNRKKAELHHIQIEDAIHVAKHGKEPPKFPEITRAAAGIGLTAAILNVVNFIYSAKTTALATTQFSTPPTPPTLIDTAALWDGNQYTLMPLPEEKPDAAAIGKVKRGLAEDSINRWLRKRHLAAESTAEGETQEPILSKRWIVSSVVGAGIGAFLAPGFFSTIRGKKPEVDLPPFDPYDPNILKPKDSFSAAAATLDQPLPAVQASALNGGAAPGAPPNVDNTRFPNDASYLPVTADSRTQPLVNPSTRQSLAVNPGGAYVGSGSESSSSSEAQAVLRKRTVVPASHSSDGEIDANSSSELDKRFLFSGGTASKIAGAITVGSILPLVYGGVTHARWRTENPRDRDILKELDDTPTYGAVGVPGRQPGQLATNAMPGYSDYVLKLEQQQAQQQASLQAAQQPQMPGTQLEQASPTTTDATGGGGDPVLRRRDNQSHLEKRGLLANGALALFGAGLGYAQSASQFPTDRDEEKDKKKREARKKQQEMMAAQQQQAGYPGAEGAAVGGDPLAGIPEKPLPGTADANGSAAGADPLAGIPEKPLPGTVSGTGISDYSDGGASAGAVYTPTVGSGSGSYLPATYGGAGFGSSTYVSGGGFTGGAGGASSLGASLNAAAGYRTSSSGGGGGGESVLKKRDTSSAADHKLEKRTPGFGSALTIGGTTMFAGTLLANVFVSQKQKSKPVPLVTPNADTRGPMIPGGDLYTQYLESKRIQPSGAGGSALAGGAPAAINYGASMPATVNTAPVSRTDTPSSGSGGAAIPDSRSSTDASDSATTGALDPVLKKRDMQLELQKRSPKAFAVELEAAAPQLLRAGAGAASVLGKGAAATEAGVGAASAIGRGGAAASEAGAGAFSRVGMAGRGGGMYRFPESARPELSRFGTTAAEGGFSSWERVQLRNNPFGNGFAASVYRPGGAALGAARPAMVSDVKVATGTAGTPATVKGAAAAEAEGEAAETNKGMTPLKAMGTISAGAGATMMMNGLG
ncbi:uncharacterized protein SPSC_00876 [Sporisorium scitamineum]|uniref:Uncharacterized protein n=1 Tax=Sporisorium scitamineum TaxID=49012 RepID=A0A0F7RU38_9BASI|nr:hypothetical protein [Sporisorium scitamineum]CDU22246.1 uncharacterized protein SPSC_00876 [Sporisorium scitamineum]